MKTELLRQASIDGLNVRRWQFGVEYGRHVKVFTQPRAYCDGHPWMVHAYDGQRFIATHFLETARDAFRLARSFVPVQS